MLASPNTVVGASSSNRCPTLHVCVVPPWVVNVGVHAGVAELSFSASMPPDQNSAVFMVQPVLYVPVEVTVFHAGNIWPFEFPVLAVVKAVKLFVGPAESVQVPNTPAAPKSKSVALLVVTLPVAGEVFVVVLLAPAALHESSAADVGTLPNSATSIA